MDHQMFRNRAIIMVGVAALVTAAGTLPLRAQRGQAPVQPQGTAQSQASIDLTGYWVSVVTEDWEWRMVTPPKGNYARVPLNPEGRRVADTWDLAKDVASGNQCRPFGVGGLMRMPGRLHITWQDPNTLRMEADAGTQTRFFRFGVSQRLAGERTWQGWSNAEWDYVSGRRDPSQGGSLKVVTIGMRVGYLRKNGVPYSENMILTEYFDRHNEPTGDQWFTVTSVVEDPTYLTGPFVTTTHFKKEPDGSKWHPTGCEIAPPVQKPGSPNAPPVRGNG